MRAYLRGSICLLISLNVTAGEVRQATIEAPVAGLPPVGGTELGHGEGKASSELAESGGLVHRAGRVADDQRATAWCEGSADDGIGQWVELRAPCFDDAVAWIGVVPGYASKPETFAKNNRVRLATLSLSVAAPGAAAAPVWSGAVGFSDDARMQYVNVPTVQCPKGAEAVIRLQIQEVYAGTKYRDTCVSEIAAYASP